MKVKEKDVTYETEFVKFEDNDPVGNFGVVGGGNATIYRSSSSQINLSGRIGTEFSECFTLPGLSLSHAISYSFVD